MDASQDDQAGPSSETRARLGAGLRRKDGSAGDAEISRRDPLAPCPLSFGQERLWFLDQLEPRSALYNIPRAMRLQGRLDVDALRRSLEALVARHEVLRTVFALKDGRPLQVVVENVGMELPVIDLSGRPGADAELERLVGQEVCRPFDLTRAPMLRARLFRTGVLDHVLVLTIHHIAADAWSMHILLGELGALYAALSAGHRLAIPALPIQYADYAVWQRRRLQGASLEVELAYWRRRLDGAAALLELPADRPRPAVQSYRGGTQPLALSTRLTDALVALSRRHGVTLFMTLLAAFQTLLHRYTEQDDIVVGAPVAGRTRVETEPLVGFFVNTFVLRTDLSGQPTFRGLLARVRETAFGAYAHQEVPFEKLVAELHPERTRSHSPLFQVMLAFQNTRRAVLELPGLDIQPIAVDAGVAKFDLTLDLAVEADGLRGRLEYSRDLFDAATVVRIQGQWETLLEGIVADPDRPLWRLPLLTGGERRLLLVEWNGTRREYPRDACVHELFEAQADRAPEAIALVAEERELTYRELDRQANQLARRLRTLGVGLETPVAIFMERAPETVIALLAVLKAGGAYVPLDVAYPRERLAFMLDDVGAPVLLTQARLLGELPPYPGRVLCLDADWPSVSRESDTRLASGTTAEALAYVMYTSGSTGRPKGVSVVHRSVVRLVKNTDYVSLGPDEVFLQLAPLAFDASTFEIWGSLLNGARLVLFPARIPSLAEVGDALHRYRITTLWLTAGLFHQVVERQLDSLGGLRQLLAGGDVLSARHVKRVLEQHEGVRLINGYGPTEGTTFTCCHPMTDASQVGQTVPIGRPIANTRVYVLDGHRQLVPIGVPGELCIGGDGVARGYFGRPDLTAARFVPNPFDESGERLYRTGDLARYRPDGVIEFLGRIDDQVKIRGHRVEPGEIEAVLVEHHAVQDAVVVASEDRAGHKRLVAYVVPHHGDEPTGAELRSHLKATLPDYMVPTAFVVMDVLPLTANGKVDRSLLPPPPWDLGAARPTVAPRTPLEERLAAIWTEVLGVDRVGIDDDFFERGGHSLTATQLVARVRDEFGVDLKLTALFDAPTLTGFAMILGDRLPEARPDGSDGGAP